MRVCTSFTGNKWRNREDCQWVVILTHLVPLDGFNQLSLQLNNFGGQRFHRRNIPTNVLQHNGFLHLFFTTWLSICLLLRHWNTKYVDALRNQQPRLELNTERGGEIRIHKQQAPLLYGRTPSSDDSTLPNHYQNYATFTVIYTILLDDLMENTMLAWSCIKHWVVYWVLKHLEGSNMQPSSSQPKRGRRRLTRGDSRPPHFRGTFVVQTVAVYRSCRNILFTRIGLE